MLKGQSGDKSPAAALHNGWRIPAWKREEWKMKHSIDPAHCLVGGCAIILLCAVIPTAGRAQTFFTLASFIGWDGSNPLCAPLVLGNDRYLYGTASSGGGASSNNGLQSVMQ